ncbi:alpha/beta hydrolase [Actinomyces sp. F1_1611]
MSLQMKTVATLISALYSKELATAEKAAKMGSKPRTDAHIPTGLRRECNIEVASPGGYKVHTLTPRNRPHPITVVYFHGGSYVNAIARPHWWIIRQIILRTGATVIVPSYPLAPEHSVSEAFTWINPILDQVHSSSRDRKVYYAGDSAGGGLATALALSRPAPEVDGLFLFSPWLDVTMTNPEIQAIEPHDVMLGAEGLRYWGRVWAGDWDPSDPRVSPINGNLANLPPTRIYQGERDIFLPDARRFAGLARASGASVKLFEFPDGFHVFVGLPHSPEAREAFDDLATSIGDVH